MARYVRPLDGGGADRDEVGGKAAALDRLVGWGFPIPPSVVVVVAAYRAVVRDPELAGVVRELSQRGVADDGGADDRRVEEAFLAASLPRGLERELTQTCEKLAAGGRFAVRSSATAEDAWGTSFAGQYRSFLHVPPEGLADAVQRVWASLWASGVRHYRRAQGSTTRTWPWRSSSCAWLTRTTPASCLRPILRGGRPISASS